MLFGLMHYRIGPSLRARVRRGFTAMELIVVAVIAAVLIGIFLPYLLKVRETSRRTRCKNNLMLIRDALRAYADSNHGMLPRVRYDAQRMAHSYVAYTGADDDNPFVGEGVSPNDVTGSIWLLLREGYLRDPAVFVCPSSDNAPDALVDAKGRPVGVRQRGNFRSGRHLSYSYCSPFTSAAGFRLDDARLPRFALMADKNPGTQGRGDNSSVDPDGSVFDVAVGNSNNHGHAGQNVLDSSGQVEWRTTPYCGVGQDNIYTAYAPAPVDGIPKSRASVPGVCGPQYGPAHPADSYLVPTDDRMDAAAYPVPPATRPAATGPATTQAASTQPAPEPTPPANLE